MKKKSNADELETELEKKEDELKAALNKIRELTKENSSLTFELEKAKTENIKKDETIIEERNKISELQKNLLIKVDTNNSLANERIEIPEGKLHCNLQEEPKRYRRGNSRRGNRRHQPYPGPYSANSVYLLKY